MFSRQIEELKESYQEKLENTFEMYKNAIKEHAYQSAMSNLEDDYVPFDEFLAEQQKVEVCHVQLLLRVQTDAVLAPSTGHRSNHRSSCSGCDL